MTSAGAWFDQQLRPGRVPDPRGDAVLGWYPRLKDAPAVAWKNNTGGTYGSWECGQDLVSCSLARQIVSRRQVKEVMVDFWSNLLHIPAGEDRSFPWRRAYDDVIRANALGSARLLTGFHVNVFQDFAASYVPDDHWVGRVEVLGFTHANSSKDGRAAVNALTLVGRAASIAGTVKTVAVDLGGGLIGAAASADHLRCRPRRRLRPAGSGHKSPHRSRGVKRWGDSRRQQQ
ncbi:MAG: DUF1800 family protein [Aeromicrobium sp.]